MVDFGYDISNFTDVASIYGTMEDFKDLLDTAHKKDLKVILDFVPNHSSDQHEWFQKSLKKIDPYTDYYVWHEGKKLPNGTVVAPNNWISLFGGSAWTWREERQAYYLHHYVVQQPDLNYSSPALVQQMKDVLKFWLDLGVDGFRVDAVPNLCEDQRFLDEPLSGTTNDPNDYDYTVKIYTKDVPGTYDVVKGWSELLAEYSGDKVMMIEAYTTIPMTMKYYTSGASYPFNFGMVVDLNNQSTAADFKHLIDRWIENMPEGATANWVAGNHDNPRLVSRFGPKARAVTLLTLLLPGVSVTYNGDEIGMEDTPVSWENTKDPEACLAGKNKFAKVTRDPERSPFQWDTTTSAGFSSNPNTWLPINENYKTVNLKTEKKDKDSYYNFYKTIAKLKKMPFLTKANLVTQVLSKNILLISRKTAKDGSVYAILNLGAGQETVNLSSIDKVSRELKVYYASANFDLKPGHRLSSSKRIKVPPYGIAVLIKH
ncbi:alpha-glucosidase-like isoform X2 [Nomia melanderi]|nr:alpha-glucosidase-like isoform X2 [Nomia melanderi]XP_031836520.1 alpha-glucosidase-like isoform X2 [Nomia melanderi]